MSKQTYYQKYFEENKKKSKRTWQGIHEMISFQKSKKDISKIIVDCNTISDATEMVVKFNNFFMSIEKILKKKDPSY